MAFDILTSFLGKESFSIKDSNGIKITLKGIAITDVEIKFDAKIFRNQREDGSYIVDGKVINATVIEVSLICQDINASKVLNDLLRNRGDLYEIQTRGIIFENMVCSNESLDQSPSNISSQPIKLTFKEVLFQKEFIKPTVQATDSNTIERGIAYLKETKNNVQKLATEVIGNISDSIKGFFT